jgi:hypothetical protein
MKTWTKFLEDKQNEADAMAPQQPPGTGGFGAGVQPAVTTRRKAMLAPQQPPTAGTGGYGPNDQRAALAAQQQAAAVAAQQQRMGQRV